VKPDFVAQQTKLGWDVEKGGRIVRYDIDMEEVRTFVRRTHRGGGKATVRFNYLDGETRNVKI